MLGLAKHNSLSKLLVVTVSAVMATGAFAVTTAQPSRASSPSVVVSKVVDNRYIEVDGKPFNPLAVQFRVDRAIWFNGLTLARTAGFFADAKRLGFNTISIPLPWSQLETSEGNYDYTWVNSFIDNARANGLKLEILWFGSDVFGAGASNFMPDYIKSDTTTYPIQQNSDGSLRIGGTHPQDGQTPSYSFASTNLLNREVAALHALDVHLASYDTAHTTIGVQVNNETMTSMNCNGDRSYDPATTAAYNASGYTSGSAFADYQLAVWQNTLAAEIKNGPYVVYTRMNYWCPDDLDALLQYAPNIDFHGADPYSTDISWISSRINPAKRYVSISENGVYSDAVSLMLTAYDAGAIHYDTYQLAFEMSNGQDFDSQTMVDLNHNETSYAPATSNAVTQLGKDSQLVSRDNGVNLGYFYSSSGASSYSVSKALSSGNISFSTSAGGSGVAETDPNNVYVMGFQGGGTFTISAPSAPTSVTDGYFDSLHRWVAGSSQTLTDNGNGTYSVDVAGNQFLRLQFGTAVNGEAASASSIGNGTLAGMAIDGSLSSGAVSADYPSFPQSNTITYATPQNVSGLSVSCWYCQGQGVTSFDVQASMDGSSSWTTVASSGTLSYASNDETVETRTVLFGAQLQVKGLRVVVNSANLAWHHYAINEMTPVLDGPQWAYLIMNRNLGTYLNTESSGAHVNATGLGSPTWWSAQWYPESSGDGYIRYRNRNSGDYLNNQNQLSYVEHTPLGRPDWWSAQWLTEPTSDGYVELQNRWVSANGINLHSAAGYAENSSVSQPPAEDAQWKLVPVRSS